MAGDNKKLHIEEEGYDLLVLALQIAFNSDSPCVGYAVIENDLVFYWHVPSDRKEFVQLPFKMSYNQAAQFAFNWLSQVEYPKVPDVDGDVEKGWTVHRDEWGFVHNSSYAIVAVQPSWAMYGK